MPVLKANFGGYTYLDDDIADGNCFIGNSLTNEELAVDVLDLTVKTDDLISFFTKDSDNFLTSDSSQISVFNSFFNLHTDLITKDGNSYIAYGDTQFKSLLAKPVYKYGDSVKLYHGANLVGKFYFKELKRVGNKKYEIYNVSGIGLLDDSNHFGGIYYEVKAGEIIKEIIGNTLAYSITEEVYNTTVNGWLPVDTNRNNLHQVLFAIGAGIFKDSNGDMHLKYAYSSMPTIISDDRVYIDGSVDYKTPCTRADIAEHSYYAQSTSSAETLFNTTESVKEQLIVFKGPYHTLTTVGNISIKSSGVNYAIVSGLGSLTGKAYVHTQKLVSYNSDSTGKENVISVTDATLVSTFNSYNVAKRIAQYYSAVSINTIGLVVGDERPSTEVLFSDSFDSSSNGYIKSMDISLSRKLKAITEIATGFLPTGGGNNYNNFIVLTGSSRWTPPAGVTRIHITLISGGNGGYAGTSGSWSSSGHDGDGGIAGNGGTGGRIFSTDMILEPSTGIDYVCGNGGNGGIIGVQPTSGADTTFGSYSTSNGILYPLGLKETKTGLTVCTNGSAGVAGGNGGSPGWTVVFEGVTYKGGSVGLFTFGTSEGDGSHVNEYAMGGYGGGAAVGSDGNKGLDAYVYRGAEYPSIVGRPFAGKGGEGASPTPRADSTIYGSGGNGGHGGGGGGSAGTTSYGGSTPNSAGGAGGNGGKGSPGAIIIYY